MKKLLSLFLSIVLLLFAACSEDDLVINEPAPDIPPEGTLVMPFETFEDTGGRVETKLNAGTARLVVAFWQLASLPLAIPAIAFKASFTQTGKFVDGEWIWSYQFNGGNNTAELHASIVNSGVKWEMFISEEGKFTDFLWFEGVSQIDGLAGNWILYKSPTDQTKVLDIVWSRNIDGSVAEIKYTNVEGGYIEYGINEETPYDAFYIVKGNNGDMVEILWNQEKKNGQITAVDGQTYCWDMDFEDIDC